MVCKFKFFYFSCFFMFLCFFMFCFVLLYKFIYVVLYNQSTYYYIFYWKRPLIRQTLVFWSNPWPFLSKLILSMGTVIIVIFVIFVIISEIYFLSLSPSRSQQKNLVLYVLNLVALQSRRSPIFKYQILRFGDFQSQNRNFQAHLLETGTIFMS